jgi:uncharacterized protein (TIGR03663 family)
MSQSEQSATGRQGPVTVERLAYALVALLAAWLLWGGIGGQPLSDGEAAQALAAYRFLHAGMAAPEGTVPALFTANVLGFTLWGAGDAAARWLPALAGLALVLLPYGLRHRLGRGGALAASLLLAISPSVVYHSRQLEGSIVVAACALALVVGLVRFVDTHRPAGLNLAAAGLGLGLCAGAGIYTLLLILLFFGGVPWLVQRLRGRAEGWPALGEAWQVLRREKGWARRPGAVLLAVLGLTATALVLSPANAGFAADLIGGWVQGLRPEAGGHPFYYPLLLLARYEPLVLVLGLLGSGVALRRRGGGRVSVAAVTTSALPTGADVVRGLLRAGVDLDRPAQGSFAAPAVLFPLGGFLIFWALAAALLAVAAGHRPAGNILLVVIPLALLAGLGIERVGHWARDRTRWIEAAAVAAALLGLAVFLYLQITAYSLSGAGTVEVAGTSMPASTGYLLLALLALALLIGLGAAVWATRGRSVLVAGGWLALLIGLGMWSFKAAWGAGHLHAGDPRELMIGQATAPEVRTLVGSLEQLSLNKSGDPHTLPVAVAPGLGPALEWALREFEQQTVLEIGSSPPEAAVVVTQMQEDLAIGEAYQGERFPLRISWQPSELGAQGLVRWVLYGAGSEPAPDRQVTLWVRVEG